MDVTSICSSNTVSQGRCRLRVAPECRRIGPVSGAPLRQGGRGAPHHVTGVTTRSSPPSDRQKVHDPRSPCEGSLRAVHPVIPLETLRETLCRWSPGGRRASRPSGSIQAGYREENSPEQIGSMHRPSLRRWGSHLSQAPSRCLPSGPCLAQFGASGITRSSAR
jgi:hypothetical protein